MAENKKNILVIDDSALMRRVTSDIINSDSRFEVTDFAVDGFDALDKIIQNYHKYSAVVLDINMPRMTGLDVLKALNKHKIPVKVIMSSTLTVPMAKETIMALELGAYDFISKPNNYMKAYESDFGKILLEKLCVACELDILPTEAVNESENIEAVQETVEVVETVNEGEPAKKSESVKKAETIKQSETVSKVGPVKNPALKTEPAKKRETVNKAEPAKKSEQINKVEPTKKSEPVIKVEPAKKTEQVKTAEPVKKAEPIKQNLQAEVSENKVSSTRTKREKNPARVSEKKLEATKPVVRKPVEEDEFEDASKIDRTYNKIVFIASSTGGPKALAALIPKLSKDIDAPVVIVQHMPKGFTKQLAERLNELSAINVKEAYDKAKLCKGTVYLASGGYHLEFELEGGHPQLKVYDGPPVNALKPCANVTIESLNKMPYKEVIFVVLTGMGNDAAKGIETFNPAIKKYVVAQDEESCVVYGMPKAIATTGQTNKILPLKEIAKEINNYTGVQRHGC